MRGAPHRVEAELEREQVVVVLDPLSKVEATLRVYSIVRDVEVRECSVRAQHVGDGLHAGVPQAVPPKIDPIEYLQRRS